MEIFKLKFLLIYDSEACDCSEIWHEIEEYFVLSHLSSANRHNSQITNEIWFSSVSVCKVQSQTQHSHMRKENERRKNLFPLRIAGNIWIFQSNFSIQENLKKIQNELLVQRNVQIIFFPCILRFSLIKCRCQLQFYVTL